MTDKLLFLTGKLAEKSLHKVLQEIQANLKTPQFKYRVEQIGVSVAALMTPELIARRLKDVGDANKVILPGLCQGDLGPLEEKLGVPVERGPEDLKDLPQYFGQQGIAPDLSQHSVQIFAEIVDAPDLSVDAIVAKAERFKQQGADVIDLGCLPGKPFVHLADAVKALKSAGYLVSVDSMSTQDSLVGEHRRAAGGDGGGGVVLRREDVAGGPAHVGAERLQALDQHRRLDGHVQAAGDARAAQRLGGGEFLAHRHQAGHLGLGDGDFLAAPFGQIDVGDLVVGKAGGLDDSVHVWLLVKAAGGRWGRNFALTCHPVPARVEVSAVETCPSLGAD